MPPFVSVIIPVYNNTHYLPDAVASVMAQTFQDWELILVDDGSTDGTGAMVDQYARSDARIRAIHHGQNQWIYAAMNTGVAAANGEYILILNSDDTLEPFALELSAGLAREHGADMVYHPLNVIECTEERGIIRRRVPGNLQLQKDVALKQLHDIRKAWFQICTAGHMTQANLFRSSLMKSHPFGTIFKAEDTLFNFTIASAVMCMAISDRPIYNYHIWVNPEKGRFNASRKYNDRISANYHVMCRRMLDLFKQWDMTSQQEIAALFEVIKNWLIGSFTSLHHKTSPLSENEIAYTLLNQLINADLIELAEGLGQRTGMEEQLVQMIQEFLMQRSISPGESMYFLYGFLCALTQNSRSPEDMETIEKGISHKNNPFHLGTALQNINWNTHDLLRKLAVSNRVIGYGALGKRAERVIEWSQGTPLEPDILWDMNAHNGDAILGKAVLPPNFASLQDNDILIVYPKSPSIVCDVKSSIPAASCTLLDTADCVNLLFTIKHSCVQR